MKITVNHHTYFYTVVGAGEPLVMLHGFTGDHSTWLGTASKLKNDYQCILIDILGHGQSDHPEKESEYEIQKVAKDIVDLLKELKIDSFHLLGYSMGGRLALALAAEYPHLIKSLILESASPGLREEKERNMRMLSDQRLAASILDRGIEAFVDYWESIPLFASQKSLPQEMQQEIRKQRLANHPIGLANSLKGMGTGKQPSYWERLPQLHMPVLLITGELDQKFCLIAKKMEAFFLRAERIEVLHAGHAIHVENSEKFGTIVKEFLFNT